MKLKEYIEGLQKIIDNNPDYAELEVCASIDDEGNGYNPIYFAPTIGHWSEDDEFFPEEYATDEELPINVVCVN